jgi:hypothetical protein
MKLLHTLFFIIILSLTATAQWKEFTDKFGTQLPSVPTNPLLDLEQKRKWFEDARPALEKYSLLVILELNCRNFDVVNVSKTENMLAWGTELWAKRGGLKMKISFNFTVPFRYSPKEFVDYVEKEWASNRDVLIAAPWKVKEEPYVNFLEIENWRNLILYEQQRPRCEVVFTPQTVCYFDLGTGDLKVVPLP